MDGNETYPDPLAQGSALFGQKVTEAAMIAALVGQVAGQVRGRRAERDAAAIAAEEAGHAAAKAAWAPALHREWLADATLPETARAWAAAAAWEHADLDAVMAADAAETRLRDLHPYAMRQYDSLRSQGRSRVSAMRESVHLFAMHPNPQPARQDVWQERYLASAPGTDGQAPPVTGMDTRAAMRVMNILAGLNEAAVAAGRGPLTAEEAALALRQRVTAPEPLIDQVIAGLRNGTVAMPTSPASRPSVATTGPGASDWPDSATDAVATGGPAAAAAPAAAAPATGTAVAIRSAATTGPGAGDWPGSVTDAVAAGRSRRSATRGPRRPQAPGHRPRLHP